ncbi:MAG: radical SAM protein [Verrucomicrobia bacterium]|nr:radical SAM protein [Verrucomicrobiota bacterium]
MNDYLTTTQSTCRVCGRLIPARVWVRTDGVWFDKICPEHGFQEARVHGDAEAYLKLSRFHRQASMPLSFAAASHGCPDSCGLCPDHEQHVCLPILEITDHCDLDCPICLVSNPARHHLNRAEVARMLDPLIASEGRIDVLNLSGGEPTMNPHFREIVEECAARKEILRVSVSTNGLRLSRDVDLLRFLAERRVIVSLQFDGLDDEICQALRGRPLLESKLRLIEQCGELDTPMSLTATVASGVNSDRVAAVADLLFQHDHVLSVMFQPAAYAGNAARLPRPATATTIPDVLAALRGAGNGAVTPEDFSPLPCSHPACFALAFYLKIDANQFVPIKRLVNAERYLRLIQNRAIFGTDAESFREITDAVYDLWSAPPLPRPRVNLATLECAPEESCACSQFVSEKALQTIKHLLNAATATGGYSPKQAWAIGERSVKSIFVHQFMDRDTFDLSRARKCCQVYPQPDGTLIPACVYNCLKRP